MCATSISDGFQMRQHLLAPTPVSEWVSKWVIDSFIFGDSYRISELCELVISVLMFFFAETNKYPVVRYIYVLCEKTAASAKQESLCFVQDLIRLMYQAEASKLQKKKNCKKTNSRFYCCCEAFRQIASKMKVIEIASLTFVHQQAAESLHRGNKDVWTLGFFLLY